jgi:hypothetical protein
MAGYVNGLFSIGASGELPGGMGSYNVVYTPTPGGGYSPVLIPSTTAGGATTVIPSSMSQTLTLAGLALVVLLIVWLAK